MNRYFQLKKTDPHTHARLGVYQTAHGHFETPAFMPVGTVGAIKGLRPGEVKELGAEIILSNTYHLYLRPGHQLIQELGGLHQFMAWSGPILTDSGGYQVFSLAKFRKLREEGVTFQSHLDGSKHLLTPERVVEIQEALGSDIMMPLDECLPYPASRQEVKKSLDLTLDWEKRCLASRSKPDSHLFAICQGGMYEDYRRECLKKLVEMEVENPHLGSLGFEGYAIGGVSVGEPMELAYEIAAYSAEELPKDKPRYLMGVGMPIDIVTAIGHGIDMFDCVIPTRNARNGMLFTEEGPINIRQSRYTKDEQPISAACTCSVCTKYSRAYLRHLSLSKEILSPVLNSIHNLHYYLSLLSQARLAIGQGRYDQFLKDFLAKQKTL